MIRANEDSSWLTIRIRRSGLAPGARRSISLWITSGITFFSRKAMPRKMIVVTATIEQASSGHIKSPPLMKKLMIVCTVPGASAIMVIALISWRTW